MKNVILACATRTYDFDHQSILNPFGVYIHQLFGGKKPYDEDKEKTPAEKPSRWHNVFFGGKKPYDEDKEKTPAEKSAQWYKENGIISLDGRTLGGRSMPEPSERIYIVGKDGYTVFGLVDYLNKGDVSPSGSMDERAKDSYGRHIVITRCIAFKGEVTQEQREMLTPDIMRKAYHDYFSPAFSALWDIKHNSDLSRKIEELNNNPPALPFDTIDELIAHYSQPQKNWGESVKPPTTSPLARASQILEGTLTGLEHAVTDDWTAQTVIDSTANDIRDVLTLLKSLAPDTQKKK